MAQSGHAGGEDRVVLVGAVGLRAAHLLAGHGLPRRVHHTGNGDVGLHHAAHRERMRVDNNHGRALPLLLPQHPAIFLRRHINCARGFHAPGNALCRQAQHIGGHSPGIAQLIQGILICFLNGTAR